MPFPEAKLLNIKLFPHILFLLKFILICIWASYVFYPHIVDNYNVSKRKKNVLFVLTNRGESTAKDLTYNLLSLVTVRTIKI